MGRSIKWRNSDQIYLYTIPFLDKRLIIGVCGNVYVTVPRDVRDMDEKEGGCAVYELIETLKGASMCLSNQYSVYIYIFPQPRAATVCSSLIPERETSCRINEYESGYE